MMCGAILLVLLLLRDAASLHLVRTDHRLHHKLLTNSSMTKILGGSEAEYGKYPFIVSLELAGDHICGGSIISDYWLVTASHCLDEEFLTMGLVIRAGSMTKEEGGTVHNIDKILTHPKFDIYPMFDSDIGLIKVKEPFSSNEYVKAVHLGKQKDVPQEGEEVVAAGWGITTSTGHGDTSKYLLDVKLVTVDSHKCDAMPGMERIRSMISFSTIKINENMLCAIADSKDTTKGDSGGPLIKYEDEGEDPVLVGVVSWGEGNGRLDSPGVYCNVANFVKWLYLETVTLPTSSAYF